MIKIIKLSLVAIVITFLSLSSSAGEKTASKPTSPSRIVLKDFAISKWSPTSYPGNTIWIDEYYGQVHFEPCFLPEKAVGKPLPEHQETSGWHDIALAIDSKDILAFQVIVPTFDEKKQDDHQHPIYKVTLRNGVHFFGDASVKRFEYDAEKEGYPARIKYEWTSGGRYYDRKSIKEIIATVKFPVDSKDPLEITYLDGRTISSKNWRFIVGSKRNWNPTSDTLSIIKDDAAIKIPVNDIIKLTDPSPWTETTVLLADKRSLRGKIAKDESADKWHGMLDVEGITVEIEAPYDYLKVLDLTARDGNARATWAEDRPVFFK